MSDLADIANDLTAARTEARLAQRVRFEGVSREDCLECGADIPQRRRDLLPGVKLCVDCQDVSEGRRP